MSAEPESLTAWLERFIADNGAVAGTIHRLDGNMLRLMAAVNIPPKVREITATIPRGKGMAGLAWERMAAVSSCNIKTDESGDVRPGARAVDAQAAVAVPVTDEAGAFWGVVGIAFHGERELGEDELARIEAAAHPASSISH